MFDYYVKIYLYLLILVNLFFILLYALTWFIRRQPLLKPKAIWRDVLFLIVGAISLPVFNSGMLEGWVVLLITGVLLIGSVYAVEAVEKLGARRGTNNRAT